MSRKIVGRVAPIVLAAGIASLPPAGAPALARPASVIEVEIGGYMEQSVGAAINSPGVRVSREGGTSAVIATPNPVAQRADSEIWFQGRGRLTETLTIGFVVQLEADSQPDRQIDESYLYLDGRPGRILLGAENDAAYLQHVSVPRAGAAWGVLESAATGWVFKPRHVSFLGTTAPMAAGDARKVTYFTPRIGGTQLGVSATPADTETARDLSDRARERSWLATLSANGRWNWGETALSLSGGWVHGMGAPAAASADRRAPVDDAALGAELRHRGLAVGAGFRRLSNPGGAQNGRAMAAGIAWDHGPWAAGLGAISSRTAGMAAGRGTDLGDLALLSGSYSLGPGVHLTAALFAARFAAGRTTYGAEDRNLGYGATSGLRLAF